MMHSVSNENFYRQHPVTPATKELARQEAKMDFDSPVENTKTGRLRDRTDQIGRSKIPQSSGRNIELAKSKKK